MSKKTPPICDPALYPEFNVLRENCETIRQELSNNKNWYQWPSDARGTHGNAMFLQGNWTIFPLYFSGIDLAVVRIPGLYRLELEQLLSAIPNRFPQTSTMLQSIPRINFAAFSRLHAHSKLEPHRHKNPNALIMHLGLEIPGGNTCGLKVGTRVHHWRKAGDIVIFNDNFLHSAWNNSDQDRIILYVDFKP